MTRMQKFYNKEWKDQYLEYIKTKITRNSLSRTITALNRVAVIEERFQKDICFFQVDSHEAKALYLDWLNNCVDAVTSEYISMLRRYINWAYDTGLIDSATYMANELTSMMYDSSSGEQRVGRQVTKRVSDQQKLGKEEEPDKNVDFIFDSENALFNYFGTVFKDGKYAMYGAIMVLYYYGFDIPSMRSLLKSDVDDSEGTIAGVRVDNTKAFDLILRAKYIEGYDSHGANKSDYYKVKAYFEDNKYLLRGRWKSKDPDERIPEAYIYKTFGFEKEAVKKLPEDSPYKGILVKPKTVSRMRGFFEMYKDELEYGEPFVKMSFMYNKYDVMYDYNTYLLMRAKVRSI